MPLRRGIPSLSVILIFGAFKITIDVVGNRYGFGRVLFVWEFFRFLGGFSNKTLKTESEIPFSVFLSDFKIRKNVLVGVAYFFEKRRKKFPGI